MKKINLLALLFLSIGISATYAQTNKELAKAKLKQAIKIEDESEKYDEALVLLYEAEKLDPEDYTIRYEQSYTYGKKGEHQKSADILEKLLSHKDVTGQTYQALGNDYDYLGKKDKAIQTYQKGLTLFPKSGELYVELGNMALMEKNNTKALGYYEKGISVDPTYRGNYYRAAKIYLSEMKEEVWGMIYGELFMNLERNTARTAEISKLLYDTYKSEISFSPTGQPGVSFSKSTETKNDDVLNGRSPFIMIYEHGLINGASNEQKIDLESLSRIRSAALTYYSMLNAQIPIKNLLFDYQAQIKAAGHFDAYNHWILMKGDEPAFDTWQTANKAKWDAFVNWFSPNPIKVTELNKFVRPQQ